MSLSGVQGWRQKGVWVRACELWVVYACVRVSRACVYMCALYVCMRLWCVRAHVYVPLPCVQHVQRVV
jgi:hypothetical protein